MRTKEVIDINGISRNLWTQEGRDYWVNQRGKSPLSFDPAPPELMATFGEQLYTYHHNITATIDFWGANFAAAPVPLDKPGFAEIFTQGRGDVTNEEVRAEEKRLGLPGSFVDDNRARSNYNEKLSRDLELYTEDFDDAELSEMLDTADFARWRQVSDWWEKMTGARPIAFGFKTPKVISEDVIHIETESGEQIPHVVNSRVEEVGSIGVAFPGEKCLKRDLFESRLGEVPAAGIATERLPGRDRWFRITGVNTFAAFLYSPVHTMSRIIIDQIQHGKPVLLPMSPIVPPDSLRRG